MATESIVIDVQINQSEAADKLAGVTKEVVALTNEQKKLRPINQRRHGRHSCERCCFG